MKSVTYWTKGKEELDDVTGTRRKREKIRTSIFSALRVSVAIFFRFDAFGSPLQKFLHLLFDLQMVQGDIRHVPVSRDGRNMQKLQLFSLASQYIH